MTQPKFENRTLILSEDVDNTSVKDLIWAITSFNQYDDFMESSVVGYQRQAIVLIVNSFGGSVYDGFGLISAIEVSATPVITVCFGSAMSMGFAIFTAGHQRVAHDLSTFMYHEIWSSNFGKLTEQKLSIEEQERIQIQYDLYVLSKTKLTEFQLDAVKKDRKDWYIDAQQAMALGIVDVVADDPIHWVAE